MVNVKLDENKYFTGSYAKVGKVSGGVDVPTLPEDMSKATYYQYKKYEISEEVRVEIPGEIIKTPIMDEETGEQKIDEFGNPVFETTQEPSTWETQTIKTEKTGWLLDQEKYDVEVLEKIKTEKITFIDNYKHEARLNFPYGNVGGIQRFTDGDINFINLTIEGFKKGLLTEVYWKYSNGKYDHVTDVTYLEDMLLAGGMLINKSFEVELSIVSKIQAMTSIEELNSYNEKEEFNKEFREATQS